MDFFDNWTVQVRKGLLELCILNLLLEGEQYGYDIIRKVLEVPGFGITEGTLYPLLSRLRLQGLVQTRLVESSSGPARKYYALTAKGRKTASIMNEHLQEILNGLRSMDGTDER
ncbi:hypothetical protein PDESU_02357 [Pontiella desulfatans]|uniref:Transcription regulator PadR N-terminal domain-containing protein n=1 Tax=Pontiella desulfatans TaxID=2750659 RepID=A0A6C2U1E9_PONDE|nr:PadR family transcriptional regulator [Pontiella desulfatans]VGO13800.1 hypothetical protein PDESU_02357 [Pontiella desulfatans]